MPETGVCHACRADRPRFSAQRSWAVFAGPVRQALHRLKYQGDVALGEALAYGLVELLDDLFWRVEVVVPVPLGAERRRERGYNQAALLARPVALACGLSYAPSLLEKTHPNRPQVGLNAAQRRQNVRGVYTAQKNQAAGKQVLVIDDVTTTGATLDDCARALLEAGAQCVYGLTLARAVLHV